MLPTSGRSVDTVLTDIATDRGDDLDWARGRAFSLVYHSDSKSLLRLQRAVAADFLHENALNPFRYRSLLRMETELVATALDLLGGVAGGLTGGGSESIFLAVHAARQWGLERGVDTPTIVVPDSAHPAFGKACHYLGVGISKVPVGPDLRVEPAAVDSVIDGSAVMVVGSAPCYPYGVVDPIDELAGIAARRGILCHVDACLGGWILPWWKELGRQVRPWDLRVDGVTSLSADLHKYGYATKGISVLLHAEKSQHLHQIYTDDAWAGGGYLSATTAGSRPGAPIAVAWATQEHLGRDGYLHLANRVLNATVQFREGLDRIGGFTVTGEPDASVFEFSSGDRATDAKTVAALEHRGWSIDLQPGGLHVVLSPGHDRVIAEFLDDLDRSRTASSPPAGPARPYSAVIAGVAQSPLDSSGVEQPAPGSPG